MSGWSLVQTQNWEVALGRVGLPQSSDPNTDGCYPSLQIFQQFPRVTSIGSLPPKPSENPADPRRAPQSPRRAPAEPSERPPQSPLRGKFPRRASRRVVPLGWWPSGTLEDLARRWRFGGESVAISLRFFFVQFRDPTWHVHSPLLWTLQEKSVTVFGMANGLAMWGENSSVKIAISTDRWNRPLLWTFQEICDCLSDGNRFGSLGGISLVTIALSTDRWKSPVALNIAKAYVKWFGNVGGYFMGKNRAISTDRWRSPIVLNIAKEICDGLWDGNVGKFIGKNRDFHRLVKSPIALNISRNLLEVFLVFFKKTKERRTGFQISVGLQKRRRNNFLGFCISSLTTACCCRFCMPNINSLVFRKSWRSDHPKPLKNIPTLWHKFITHKNSFWNNKF